MVLSFAAAARRWRQAVPCPAFAAAALGSEIAGLQVSCYARNAVAQRSREGTRRVAREARSCRSLQNPSSDGVRVPADFLMIYDAGFWR